MPGLRPGAVVVETSTVSPETVRALAAPVRDAGATLLDGPVSGSVPVVERGELTVLAGGDAAALDTARPVLGTFASTVLHLGPLGAGATMKLVVNGVVHALNQAVSEALVLAEKAGVDRRAAYEVFTASAVAAPYVHYKRAAFEDPDGTPVAFRLDLVAKDLALLAELAASRGRPHGPGRHEPPAGRRGAGGRLRRPRHQRDGRVPTAADRGVAARIHAGPVTTNASVDATIAAVVSASSVLYRWANSSAFEPIGSAANSTVTSAPSHARRPRTPRPAPGPASGAASRHRATAPATPRP